MEVRLIEQDTPDLPHNFAVVSGRTAEEGIEKAAAAFERPGVNMVTWIDAMNQLPPEDRETIARLVVKQNADKCFTTGLPGNGCTDYADGLTRVFNNFSAEMCTDKELSAVRRWQETTHKLLAALDKVCGVRSIIPELRCDDTLELANLHADDSRSWLVTSLRTIANDTTLFAADADLLPRLSSMPQLRPDAKFLWAPSPWTVTLLSAESLDASVAHTQPFAGFRSPARTRRGIEVIDAVTSRPLIPARA